MKEWIGRRRERERETTTHANTHTWKFCEKHADLLLIWLFAKDHFWRLENRTMTMMMTTWMYIHTNCKRRKCENRKNQEFRELKFWFSGSIVQNFQFVSVLRRLGYRLGTKQTPFKTKIWICCLYRGIRTVELGDGGYVLNTIRCLLRRSACAHH